MFKIKCFCGKSEKTFLRNIGPHFHAECCEEAGFDHLGNKKEIEEVLDKPVDIEEKTKILEKSEAIIKPEAPKKKRKPRKKK